MIVLTIFLKWRQLFLFYFEITLLWFSLETAEHHIFLCNDHFLFSKVNKWMHLSPPVISKRTGFVIYVSLSTLSYVYLALNYAPISNSCFKLSSWSNSASATFEFNSVSVSRFGWLHSFKNCKANSYCTLPRWYCMNETLVKVGIAIDKLRYLDA